MVCISARQNHPRDAHGLAAPEYSGDLCLWRTVSRENQAFEQGIKLDLVDAMIQGARPKVS